MLKVEEFNKLKSISGEDFVNKIKSNEITENKYKSYLKYLISDINKNYHNEWISNMDIKDIEKININKIENTEKPLNGLLISIKDNIMTYDFITTAGTLELKRWKPIKNHPVVDDLINNGCIITGKTNLHELALGITSSNKEYGIVKNPNNVNLIPGGSSGGSAVSIKNNLSHISIGTDTCGSCRIPASLTGCFGYKPTTGIYTNKYMVPISYTLDTIGFLANNIGDIKLIDKYLKKDIIYKKKNNNLINISLCKNYFWKNLDDETNKICNSIINQLDKNIDINILDENIINHFNIELVMDIINYEHQNTLEEFIEKNEISTNYEKLTKNIYKNVLNNKKDKYIKSIKERNKLINDFKTFYNDKNLDVIIYPTTILPAVKIGQDENLELMNKFLQNSCIGSFLGFPCISIPIGYNSNNLPVGIEIMGLPKSDKLMFDIANIIHNASKNID